MDFYAMVDQVVQLLQQRGRLTYRALQVQFQLDDATCEALKAEVLFAHPVVDHEGRGLIWTGAAEAPPARLAAAPSAQTSPPPPAEAEPPPQGAPLATEPHIPDAERRQLTVMFCDLVDSTKLSSQLDPEDYRDVVRGYQKVCAEVITRFDGHIAQLLGDGLLIYFGYPHAHEDDAQRAVRTGLRILAAMEDLDTRLQQAKRIQLAIRIGIHTGLVVVGDMGGVGRQEQLALGETPNIAARIQGLAASNTLVISEATSRLVEGYFTCESLGEPPLRGVSQPLKVYRVLEASGVTSRLDIVPPRGLTPLVGRESEVTLLLERWEQVKAGQGQVVLLTGDAGIGKSRLVQMLKEHVAHEPHTRWECRSSPYFEHTALFPVTDLFQRLLRFHVEDTPDAKVGKLEQMLRQHRLPLEETVPLVAPLLLLPVPEPAYPPLHLSPQRQRQKTLETLVAILLELAERQPLLFILEDLHWTDPSTLELLTLVLDQTPTASLLVLLTCRSHFQPAWHHRSYLTEITVNRLSHAQVAQVITRMTDGKTFPPEVVQQIIAKTDGVPLFIEEITQAILESGSVKAVDAHYEVTGSFSTFVIPATLQDSLMARLDRLVTAKGVAQYAAVIGRQFSYELLSMVSQLDDTTLQRELGRLVEVEIVFQRGVPPQATYAFKHALIQDAAYASLLKRTRQQYHQRIAQVLAAQFPATAETQPELLAHHATEAGLTEQAVPYWHRAGQRASERSAHVEAIAHLRQGLALIETLPETPERTQGEVDMLIALGASFRATQGFAAPEVGQTYARARQLCQGLEEPHQLFSVLRGLHGYYNEHAELQIAYENGERLLTLAQQVQDPVMLSVAHRTVGTTLFYLGAPAEASTHLIQSMALSAPQQHHPAAFFYGEGTSVISLSRSAWVRWYLGYPDQGLTQSQDAVALAQQLAHPFSLSLALSYAVMLHQCRREVGATQARAEAAISLAMAQGFPQWRAHGAILRGWALTQQGSAQEGMAQMTQGVSAYRATGAEILRPYCLALLADVHGTLGQLAAGLRVLTEALRLADTTGARWYESELYRLKGALLLQQHADNHLETETCFHHALDVARRQEAKSLELRAAMSLARLWQQQGKQAEARELLAPIYGWFTEGFDTADIQDAKALLEELRG